MSRAATTTLLIVVAVAVGVFLLVRGGDDPPSAEEQATNTALSDAIALGSLEAEAELEKRSEELEQEEEKQEVPAASLDRRADRLDDLGRRAFNEQFRKTPFDRAIDKLPLRKPPLEVEQWVTDSPPDKLSSDAARKRFYRLPARARKAAVRRFYRSAPTKLYARVDKDRWYRMSERARAAAVRAFYRDAEKVVNKKGIRDFVLVVAPLTETTEHLPPFAIGRGGTTSLTPLGRQRPDSGV